MAAVGLLLSGKPGLRHGRLLVVHCFVSSTLLGPFVRGQEHPLLAQLVYRALLERFHCIDGTRWSQLQQGRKREREIYIYIYKERERERKREIEREREREGGREGGRDRERGRASES